LDTVATILSFAFLFLFSPPTTRCDCSFSVGDISPVSKFEVVYAVFVIIIGTFVYFYLFETLVNVYFEISNFLQLRLVARFLDAHYGPGTSINQIQLLLVAFT
jgi:hypothetical protein